MVARAAGAAGPVLLACRQWDPLGLAQRLPSLGVGAWRSAPLLPWRVQCPVRVCAALAAGSGGSGRYLVLCLSRFPHSAPRVPRCVWWAVPSGCPLPSLAGTPFHAVCAFRVLGPVALLVVPTCALRVCALVLTRRPLPPPLGGVARAPRAVPALGAGRAVPRGLCPSACPAPVSYSVWRASGGAVRSRFPPIGLLLRGTSEVRRSPSSDCPPTGRAVGVRYPRAVGAGVWVWGPNTVPLACMPCGGCMPRGWCGGGASRGGGVACHCCEGRLVSGAVPPPTARPLGGLPGPPTHWLWVRGGAGVETHHQPHRVRSCELALRAVGPARGRPGGGASCLGVGRPGWGALQTPDCPPSGQAARAHYPLAVGDGGCERGDPSPTPQPALLLAVGAA